MLIVYVPPRNVHLLKRWLDAAVGALRFCQNPEEMQERINAQQYAWLIELAKDA